MHKSQIEPDVTTDTDPFQTIVGERLSSITFVQDYWQLDFDGVGVSALTRIEVQDKGSRLGDRDDRFRNVLCEQIGKTVKRVTLIQPEALTITFDDQSSIAISLRWKDYRGPEALILRGRDGFLRVVRADG